jgi:uncharacterized membrane protein YcaP (DUF421 family)
MNSIITTSARTLIGFAVLLLLTRILGKKQLSQMTFFTYITGIALGNIAGDMVVHRDIKISDAVIALTLWAFLTFSIEYISLKSAKARVLLDGEPTIIIKKGKINKKAMHSNKVNMDDLSMLLRTKDVFSITEVDYAILEPNGQFSVLKKVEHEGVTKKEANLPLKTRQYLPSELIVDGQIVERNLKEFSLSKEWLSSQLQTQGVTKVEDVLYAELQTDGSLYLDM